MKNNLLPFVIISAIVALLDVVPLFYRRCTKRYLWAVFTQMLVTGLVIFLMAPLPMPWWVAGPVVAVALLLPQLILPPVRGAYEWYGSLLNAVVAGFVFALIRRSLSEIAVFFT